MTCIFGADYGGLPDVAQAPFRILAFRGRILPTTERLRRFDKKRLQSGDACGDDDEIVFGPDDTD